MKRRALLGHLQEHGCVSIREGGSHSIWHNPQTGRKEVIPRHNEIKSSSPGPSAAICPCRFRPATDRHSQNKNLLTVRIGPAIGGRMQFGGRFKFWPGG